MYKKEVLRMLAKLPEDSRLWKKIYTILVLDRQ